ncbi:MAG: hypothetical protein IJ300_10870 [Clostridia bacterium]|nr:hypothetical protein [Clostridia bacterium]
MMKYQKPEMDIMKLWSIDVITASGETLYPSTDTDGDGNSVGGNGGGSWGGF